MVKLDFSNILYEQIGDNGLSASEVESTAKKAISLFSEMPYKELEFLDIYRQDLTMIKELAKKSKRL